MNLLRRKPKAPSTPARRYEEDLVCLFVLGLLVGLTAALIAIVPKILVDMRPSYTTMDVVAAAFVMIFSLLVLVAMLKVYVRTKRRLMDRAPQDGVDQVMGRR